MERRLRHPPVCCCMIHSLFSPSWSPSVRNTLAGEHDNMGEGVIKSTEAFLSCLSSERKTGIHRRYKHRSINDRTLKIHSR
jgi:hypothetical protein